jgi:hypothetical protein
MTTAVHYARAGMGAKVRGQALVAKDGFSARYDLDRLRGVFSRAGHKLAGESYVGRVLVLDAAKGGVATAWMLHEMKSRGIVPAALAGAQCRQSDHGAGRRARAVHHDLRLRPRHHAGDPERRHGGGRPDRGAAVHSCRGLRMVEPAPLRI